jgi:hypothetical protein
MNRIPDMVCVPHRVPGCLACIAPKRSNRPEEVQLAEARAVAAEHALQRAIEAYDKAGFGSHVSDPLREALSLVQYSLSEVRS